MAKICFPHYKKGEFASLADALKFLNRETYSVSRYALCEIVHISHFYESYPVFDSYDLGDDRIYQNYIFRPAPITEANMKDAFCTFHGFNFSMVHENISEENLPILYYRGDGKYMLLATAKS